MGSGMRLRSPVVRATQEAVMQEAAMQSSTSYDVVFVLRRAQVALEHAE